MHSRQPSASADVIQMQKKQNAVLTENERGRDKIEIEEFEKESEVEQNSTRSVHTMQRKIRKEGKIKSEQFHKIEI